MRCYGIWNMWFPWADTNCNSSLWWRSLAQPRSSIAVPILSDDVSDVGRNHTLNPTCPQNPQTVKTQELMGSDEDSTRDNINNYNFRISQIWIKLGMLGNPSPCAPLLRPLCMALLRKSTNPIFWELPQSQEPQAPDLWHMSGAKPLRRIFPKNVSGVVQDPSECKILWDDRVGWPTFHKILPHGITHLRCARPGETTITSSRPNQPMPRKTTRTFLLRECKIHAKPRSWTTLTAATPPAPAYTSRNTATALFRELFCCKIPEKDVTKAWSKVMWNSHRILTRKILTHKLLTYTDFSPTHFSPTDFSQTDFNIQYT